MMKKVWLILLAVVLVFGLGVFGCSSDSDGDGDGDGTGDGITLNPDDYTETEITLVEGKYLRGDEYTAVMTANPFSFLEIIFTGSKPEKYGIGNIGGLEFMSAGENKKVIINPLVSDIIPYADTSKSEIFFNIWDGAINSVKLKAAREGLTAAEAPEVLNFKYATEGGIKIVVPPGFYGIGKLGSKEYEKIKAAGNAGKKLVLTFEGTPSWCQIEPKRSDYNDTGLDANSKKSLTITGSIGEVTVANILAGIANEESIFITGTITGIGLNFVDDGSVKVLYAELQ
jgi:hypothetical protein